MSFRKGTVSAQSYGSFPIDRPGFLRRNHMICQRLRDSEVGLHHGWCLFKGGKETNEQMCHKLLVVVCLRYSIFGTLQINCNQNLIQQKIRYRLIDMISPTTKRNVVFSHMGFKLLDLLMIYSQQIQPTGPTA